MIPLKQGGREVGQMTHCGPFLSDPSCDSVILISIKSAERKAAAICRLKGGKIKTLGFFRLNLTDSTLEGSLDCLHLVVYAMLFQQYVAEFEKKKKKEILEIFKP